MAVRRNKNPVTGMNVKISIHTQHHHFATMQLTYMQVVIVPLRLLEQFNNITIQVGIAPLENETYVDSSRV